MYIFELAKILFNQRSALNKWYSQELGKLEYPIYSSYDIRDSGFKIAPVDANIYPAGFNNISPDDLDLASASFDRYIEIHFDKVERILLVTEEHTANKFYWNNVISLKAILEKSGRKVLIAFPQTSMAPITVESASYGPVEIIGADFSSKAIKDFHPDIVLSNNDFSLNLENWAAQVHLPITPPRELGWYRRKKSEYFKHYNEIAKIFSEIAGVDPLRFQVKTQVFEDFDIQSDQSQEELALHVDQMLKEIKADYERLNILQVPKIFIKNNSGTYGLAVTQVNSGDEVRQWTYKSRKKMKAAKGGRQVNELILQEGIQSRIHFGGASAEPVIYMAGCKAIGSFLRFHLERGDNESLNAPGSSFHSLGLKQASFDFEYPFDETPYAWATRLGVLALGLEAKAMDVHFKNFRKQACDLSISSNS